MTATAPQPIPLLMTKLVVPRVQPGLIVRSRMVERLDEGLHRRLTLVSAPPGFGKTTLVSGWIDARQRDHMAIAWLSLDERDNDPERFLTYLVEAFHLASPECAEAARSLVRSLPNAPPELVVTHLINNLSGAATKITLVLDDYHVIEQPQIHGALNLLIERAPAQLHIILISRSEPPIALSRLRVRNEMIDIGDEELRFTEQEAARFLRKTIGLDIDAEGIRELEQRTEGWVAGLQLAAISMRGRDDIQAFIHSFSGEHHHIVDYLVDEVLNRQSPEVQTFLLQTALFDRMSAGLCDAVTRRTNSHAMLESLERSKVFIITLDSERRWFRYHHLFADVLRQRLRQGQSPVIPELRRRASIWFEEYGDPVEAIWQAIRGLDWPRVHELTEANYDPLFDKGQSRTLLRLMQAVPDEIVRSYPWLLYTRAWSGMLNGEPLQASRDITTLGELVEQIDRDPQRHDTISEADRRTLLGSVAGARAIFSIAESNFEATLDYSDRALQLMPDDAYSMRSMVEAFRSQVLWLMGELQASVESSIRTLALTERTDAPLFRIIGLLNNAAIEMEWGNLDRAEATYREAIAFAEGRGLSQWQYLGRVMSFASEVPYERNALGDALQLAERGRELAAHWTFSQAYDITYLHLARVLYALGDVESARAALQKSPPDPGRGPGAVDAAHVEVRQALLDLELGDRRKLAAIEDDLLLPVPPERIWLWTSVVRVRGQLLNALGRYNDAVALLTPQLEIQAERRWIRQTILTGSVLAISLFHAGDHRAAIRRLEEVLSLAESRGMLRSILDAGNGIDVVIEATLESRRVVGRDTVFLNRLLRIAREERGSTSAASPAMQGLVDPLSERELVVLRLIAAGHTNAGIADELFVALGTVKAHAYNIYSKLGVRNRTQAVARARALRLVD